MTKYIKLTKSVNFVLMIAMLSYSLGLGFGITPTIAETSTVTINPQIIKSLPYPSVASLVSNPYLYLLSSAPDALLKVYNVSDLNASSEVGRLVLTAPKSISQTGNYLIIGDEKTFKVVDASNPANPVLISTLSMPDYVQSVTISSSRAYVACGTGGMVMVDISAPVNPRIVNVFNSPGLMYLEVAVSGNFAYIADAVHNSLLKVNIFNLPPASVGAVILPDRPLDVAVSGNYAYVAATSAGMMIVDINNMQIIGAGAPIAFGQASSIAISGNLAYVESFSYTSSANGLQIFDISKSGSPTQAGFVATPGRAKGGISLSGRYVYLSGDYGGTFIIDLYYDYLKVEKTASKTSASQGDEITYTLKVTNPTPYTLTGLNLSDPVPDSTSYVAGSATSSGGSFANNKVTWTNHGSIAPNATIEVSFKVEVN